MEEITGTLDQWYYEHMMEGTNIYRIWGHVYGDSKGRFFDGDLMHTSGVIGNHWKEGDIVTTVYSKYLLGKQAEK